MFHCLPFVFTSHPLHFFLALITKIPLDWGKFKPFPFSSKLDYLISSKLVKVLEVKLFVSFKQISNHVNKTIFLVHTNWRSQCEHMPISTRRMENVSRMLSYMMKTLVPMMTVICLSLQEDGGQFEFVVRWQILR